MPPSWHRLAGHRALGPQLGRDGVSAGHPDCRGGAGSPRASPGAPGPLALPVCLLVQGQPAPPCPLQTPWQRCRGDGNPGPRSRGGGRRTGERDRPWPHPDGVSSVNSVSARFSPRSGSNVPLELVPECANTTRASCDLTRHWRSLTEMYLPRLVGSRGGATLVDCEGSIFPDTDSEFSPSSLRRPEQSRSCRDAGGLHWGLGAPARRPLPGSLAEWLLRL